MRSSPDPQSPLPQRPFNLGRQLATWRTRRQLTAEAAQPQQQGQSRSQVDGVVRHGAALVADLPHLLALGRSMPTSVECLPATTPPTRHPPIAQAPTPSGVAARHLLSITTDDSDLEELEGDDEMEGASQPAGVSLRLEQPPRRVALPPPVPSAYFAGLPPALPPLPSPLESLLRERQRLESKLHALPPPLPPPVLLGAQCSPSTASTCESACDGGTCECDLYPDYSEAGLRDDRPQDTSHAQLKHQPARSHRVTPPSRHTLFFNSDFKGSASLPPASRSASPPDTVPHRSHHSSRRSRRRLTEDKKSGPALHLLCHCVCPSIMHPF